MKKMKSKISSLSIITIFSILISTLYYFWYRLSFKLLNLHDISFLLFLLIIIVFIFIIPLIIIFIFSNITKKVFDKEKLKYLALALSLVLLIALLLFVLFIIYGINHFLGYNTDRFLDAIGYGVGYGVLTLISLCIIASMFINSVFCWLQYYNYRNQID